VQYRIQYQRILERRFIAVDESHASQIMPCGLHEFTLVLPDESAMRLSAAKTISLLDLSTGELLNPWNFTENSGCMKDGRKLLSAVLWEFVPAMKWLRFYAHTIEKTRPRHIRTISEAAAQSVNLDGWEISNVDSFISDLFVGDIRAYFDGDRKEYDLLLQCIPSRLRPTVRACAQRLLIGSRKLRPNEKEALRLENDLSAWQRDSIFDFANTRLHEILGNSRNTAV
jgi:hypothetical protein